MKKAIGMILTLVFLFAGCASGSGSSAQSPASAPPAPAQPASQQAAPAKASTLTITFSNSSAYTFNEIYISPTASSDWGDEVLGSTRILKSNGSLELDIPAYDFDNYDILVVDEDRDEYHFTRVPLQNGNEVSIYFGDAGLAADVYDAKGTSITTVYGALEGLDTGGDAGAGATGDAGGGGGGDVQVQQQEPQPTVTGTGNDTNGQYSFTVYNESAYDIYAIHMGVSGASAEHDIDILPQILPAGQSIDLTGMASQGDWLNTEWTLYITDVDGDTSASFELFNPWTITYVDIHWDSNNGGYICNFVY